MRLFVPGHYGVASVKWLRAMRVIDHAYPGFFQTTKYSVNRPGPGGKVRQPIGASAVKSAILQPPEGAQLGLGRHLVAGLAWAGEEKIAGVEVSSDGGAWVVGSTRVAGAGAICCAALGGIGVLEGSRVRETWRLLRG
jgi:hypothetical protein